jgi:hypothetical protein
MAATARGAGSSGACHHMAVNETVIALLRPKPDLARLEGEPGEALAAAQAAVDAPDGLGTIASYTTEVPLPVTGTWNAPEKGSAQADIVLTAPEAGVPLLFVDVDSCYEAAEKLAEKIDKYARFFQRTVTDTDGEERPMWRTRWPAPWDSDPPHPPVLLVFHCLGPRNPNHTTRQLAELTRKHWQGHPAPEGYHTYEHKIPPWRPSWRVCVSTDRPARCSGASAATACSPFSRRSATLAGRGRRARQRAHESPPGGLRGPTAARCREAEGRT